MRLNQGGSPPIVIIQYLNGTPPIKQPRGLLIQGRHYGGCDFFCSKEVLFSWMVGWWSLWRGSKGSKGSSEIYFLHRNYVSYTHMNQWMHIWICLHVSPCHITEDRYAIIAEVSRYPLEPCLQEWQSVVFLFCRSLVATFLLRWWSWPVAHCIGGLFILVFSVVVIWVCSKYGTPINPVIYHHFSTRFVLW